MIRYDPSLKIILPETHRQIIVEHCRRKLAGTYLPGGTHERKAYGLIAGHNSGTTFTVKQCFPLLKNARFQEPYKEYMDRVMDEFAYPSKTPLSERGWIADPAELVENIQKCRKDGMGILGSYHMHRIAWDHDPLRDTPTMVDTVLVEESRSFRFIVSMVDPGEPIIRTFFEGKKERETPVVVK